MMVRVVRVRVMDANLTGSSSEPWRKKSDNAVPLKTEREKEKPFPIFNPADDLYGRTYVTRPDDYGEQARTKIVGSKKLEDSDKIGPGNHPKDLVKWMVKVGEEVKDELMTYI